MRTQSKILGYKGRFVKQKEYLTEKDYASLVYHDIFDYPLTLAELVRWLPGKKVKACNLGNLLFKHKSGHFYLDGREGIVLRRLMRQRSSKKKIKIAKKAARVLAFIPTIKGVGITGALAMKNADETADIDLIIITTQGTLWISRFLSMVLLVLFGFSIRRFGQRDEKDKLCLNIWLDETDLLWEKRNIYTAHEIAQIIPLVNKNCIFEKFFKENKWIKNFWPNAVRLRDTRNVARDTKSDSAWYLGIFILIFEPLARKLQFWYMRKKITREVVTKTRALFHPIDWSKYIMNKIEGKLEIAS
jgi:predicted nucleotidyltransferase